MNINQENIQTELIQTSIESELSKSYLNYAMSVIVGRALPDARDGLKPVHRRILYAMYLLSNLYNKPYKKSARIVGDVIGKYHPHGDTAVYDAIVRMAQDFSMRYVLVDGQGNFGSIDGDAAAAMRYTEIRMSRIAEMILQDIHKNTVDFAPNYDGSEKEPVVLPTPIPNLIINGSSGIAVGMATNIPPHNLHETINACIALIDDEAISVEDIIKIMPGPDFPTYGIIQGRSGILNAYKTGKGRIIVKAKTEIETYDRQTKQRIIVTELPYQVDKAKLQERIGELVRDKKIESISNLRDESDRSGMRIVIDVKRSESPEVVLKQLFAYTQMQISFNYNIVALLGNQPKLMNIKELLEAFIAHRRDVVTRQTQFDLDKAKDRKHILEGLGIAISNIDEVIALIKSSKDQAEAKIKLMEREWDAGFIKQLIEIDGFYRLDEIQAQAILDLRLHRLTGLEQSKIIQDYNDLLSLIARLRAILEDQTKLMNVIRTELIEMRNLFSDARRTVILDAEEESDLEDLIQDEQVVVTISEHGYIKTQQIESYRAQKRGGRGKTLTNLKEDDFVKHLLVANTLDTLLCFTTLGKVYWLKVHKISQASPYSKGKPIVNLLNFTSEKEKISTIIDVRKYSDDKYVFLATKNGVVKKTSLSKYANPRTNGVTAITIDEGDEVIGAAIAEKNQDIMLFSSTGKAIRFNENKIRAIARKGRGVRGIKLKENQSLISIIIASESGYILNVTEKGYGKRTEIGKYRITSRGGIGVASIKITKKVGNVLGAILANETDEILLVSDKGIMVRTKVSQIKCSGRATQGIRLIKLQSGDKLSCVQKIEKEIEPSEI